MKPDKSIISIQIIAQYISGTIGSVTIPTRAIIHDQNGLPEAMIYPAKAAMITINSMILSLISAAVNFEAII